jgi:hypothetical protein
MESGPLGPLFFGFVGPKGGFLVWECTGSQCHQFDRYEPYWQLLNAILAKQEA